MPDTVISCGAIVYRCVPEMQILLIKQNKNDNAWGIPKGHMEKGETQEETAVREVKEETGIKIKLQKKLSSVTLKKKNFSKLVVAYLATQECNSLPNAKNKNSEVFDAKWFSIKNLPQIYEYQKPLLEEVLLLLQKKDI